MISILLGIVFICILFIIYKQISQVDQFLDTVEYPTILIIYDEQYQILKKYENNKIRCIPKQEIYQFEQSYQYVVLCCKDDYYNLLMNYRIQRDMLDVQVYTLIGEEKYKDLYQEKIEFIQTVDDLERLIKKLYD